MLKMYPENLESRPVGDECADGNQLTDHETTLGEFNRLYADPIRRSGEKRVRRRMETALDKAFDYAGMLLVLTTAAGAAAALLSLGWR